MEMGTPYEVSSPNTKHSTMKTLQKLPTDLQAQRD